ncbi:MAG: hypothetical protein RLZZ503_396 [Actinomycetota bacterium]|jgi:hypothetical protein
MKQAHSTKFLTLLGIGLSPQRVSRLKEEYLGDADADKNAKRTAIKRVLQSYLAISNLNSLVIFLVAGLGIIASLKSMWLWATCLLIVTFFTAAIPSDLSFSSKAFKLYRFVLAALVVIACGYSFAFDNLNQYPNILGFAPYLGSYPLILLGAIALVTLPALALSIIKSVDKWSHIQQVWYVLATLAIFTSGYWFDQLEPPIILWILLDVLIAVSVFIVSGIKRKPALA